MDDALPTPRRISNNNSRRSRLSWRLQLFLARMACAVVATVGFVAGFALAQSQSTPSPLTESPATWVSQPQELPPQAQAKAQPKRFAVTTVREVARSDKARTDTAESEARQRRPGDR